MKAAPQFEITFLGTGTSHGVPMIGCDCEVCGSTDPRDHRTRTAIHIRTPEVSLVIDTPPDFRTQVLRERIRDVDAVLFTHTHTDHTSGFDDLRRFCDLAGGRLPIYGREDVLLDLRVRFPFAFLEESASVGYLCAVPHAISGPFTLGDLEIVPTSLPHGRFDSTGYVFSRAGRRLLAYYTDCKALPPDAIEAARGADVLVLDALRHRPHPTHMTVAEAKEFASAVGAERTFFTHLSHDLGHAETESTLPDSIRIAHDGLRLVLNCGNDG